MHQLTTTRREELHICRHSKHIRTQCRTPSLPSHRPWGKELSQRFQLHQLSRVVFATQVIISVLCRPDRTPPNRTLPELTELQVILDDMPGQIGDHVHAAVGASPSPTTAKLTIKLPLTVTMHGLHVRLPLMHVRKQRGQPPPPEGGNIHRQYRSSMVIRCIRQVFQHHIVKSNGHRS